MAYILGFFFADGNIIKTKRGACFISVYTSDKDLLTAMRKCLVSDHKISSRRSSSGGLVHRVQTGSKELFNDLVKLGLTPNKSKRMELPAIPEKHFGDFVRGYFDGDGNVWAGFLNKKRDKPTRAILSAFTCASHGFLRSLHSRLREKGITGGSIYRIRSKDCSRLSFSTLDTLKLFAIMYTMPHKLFLNRKKLVF